MSQVQTNATSWKTALFTPQILCFAMLVSTFIYGGLILFGGLPRGDDRTIGWVFAGIGLAGAILSFVIPGILRRQQSPPDVETREEVDPEGRSMFRDAAPTRRVVLNPQAVRGLYLSRRFAPYILALALSEVPAIMGLISWMSSDVPLASCLVLVAFGSTLIVLRFPFPKRWRADAEAWVGAVIPD